MLAGLMKKILRQFVIAENWPVKDDVFVKRGTELLGDMEKVEDDQRVEKGEDGQEMTREDCQDMENLEDDQEMEKGGDDKEMEEEAGERKEEL